MIVVDETSSWHGLPARVDGLKFGRNAEIQNLSSHLPVNTGWKPVPR